MKHNRFDSLAMLAKALAICIAGALIATIGVYLFLALIGILATIALVPITFWSLIR